MASRIQGRRAASRGRAMRFTLHREGRAADRGVGAARRSACAILAGKPCGLVHGEGRGAYGESRTSGTTAAKLLLRCIVQAASPTVESLVLQPTAHRPRAKRPALYNGSAAC